MAPFCGVVESMPSDEVVTWWFFCRAQQGSFGSSGRPSRYAATSCVRLRGDGLGSPGLSSCDQPMEKVASLSESGWKVLRTRKAADGAAMTFFPAIQCGGFGLLKSPS
jgi:hypothetical protein